MFLNRIEEKERLERELKLDLQKFFVFVILLKKFWLFKINFFSRFGVLFLRRLERLVGLLIYIRGDSLKIDLVGSLLFGILDKDFLDCSNDIDLEGFDFVVLFIEKFSYLIISRLKVIGRWFLFQFFIFLFFLSFDIFDFLSFEEDKEEYILFVYRGVDVLKKIFKIVIIF